MSVMSAAEAQQAAGADRQAAVPRSRAGTPAPGNGAAWETGHAARGRASRAWGARPRPAAQTQVHLREFQVRELRTTQVRAIDTVAPRSPGLSSPATRASAGRVVARHESAFRWGAAAGSWAAGRRAAGGRAAGRRAAGRGGVRLTKRGRLVVAWFAICVSAAVVALIWLSAAGGAAASDRGLPARTVYQGLTQIVVQPGQTLWSIASAAEPSADPRLVIQQIVQANALGGTTVQAGQLLWVPSKLIATRRAQPAGPRVPGLVGGACVRAHSQRLRQSFRQSLRLTAD